MNQDRKKCSYTENITESNKNHNIMKYPGDKILSNSHYKPLRDSVIV